MSATNRGERLGGEHDFFSTPAWCVHRLLEALPLPEGVWVEPCAGDGAIVRAVESSGRNPPAWRIYEIVPHTEELLRASAPGSAVKICNFLKETDVRPMVRVAISNPPYILAEEFIRHCRKLYPSAVVCMLLRLNFLGSAERQPWLMSDFPHDLYVLPNRPSFAKGKTDSCEYAWMIWRPQRPAPSGIIRVLGLTPKAIRCPEPRKKKPRARAL